MINALSIDVEDYWSIVSRDWLHLDAEPTTAVVANTQWFLDTLALTSCSATFFICGEVAHKFPSLVKNIAEKGHEIASHGYLYRQIFKLTPDQFRQEVADCKKLLEDTISSPILGHRAPAFSVTPKTQWALDVLAEEGYKYDSSVFPIVGKRYGWPDFSKDICRIELPSGRTIIAAPMSTVTVLGKVFPAAGGGYIRHLPYAITKWSMKRIQKKPDPPLSICTHTKSPLPHHLSKPSIFPARTELLPLTFIKCNPETEKLCPAKSPQCSPTSGSLPSKKLLKTPTWPNLMEHDQLPAIYR